MERDGEAQRGEGAIAPDHLNCLIWRTQAPNYVVYQDENVTGEAITMQGVRDDEVHVLSDAF
jgi:hypothetical protein